MTDLVKVALVLAMFVGVLWLMLRLAVFLRALLRPLLRPWRAVQRPAEQAAARHVASALRAAGLEPLAAGTEKLVHTAHRVEDAAAAGLDAVEDEVSKRRR